MKAICITLALLILSNTAISQTSSVKLSDLGWLAGCWELTHETRGILVTEMWMKPAGDAMIGVGRTMKTGKLADYEFLRIVENAEGIAYISRPSANKEDTAFRLIRSGHRELVFENPAHDFPQRIIYKLDGDRLNARIEATRAGTTRGIDFPYVRVKCE